MEERLNDLLEKKDVPAFLDNKVSRNNVDYLVTTNQIPYYRVGRRKVLFSKKRLAEWIKDQENVVVRYNKD